MQITLVTSPQQCPIVPTENPFTNKYDGEWWMTLVDVTVFIDNLELIIPAGFVTDLGSIPKPARVFLNPSDRSMIAYIVHDYLYCKNITSITRKQSDYIMLHISRICRQHKGKAYIAYYGCRLGGWLKYRKYRPTIRPIDRKLVDDICMSNNYFPDFADVFDVYRRGLHNYNNHN